MSTSGLRVGGLRLVVGGRTLLTGAALGIEPGERVGLVGPNGSGKSSLLRVLTGQLAPTRGTILYRGKDLTRWSSFARARAGLGWMFQADRLAPRESVAAHLEASGPDVQVWVERLRLDGFQTTTVDTLTGSERRRVAAALALGRSPKLLLVDEPLAGLTVGDRPLMLEALQTSSTQGTSLLWVEHEPNLLATQTDRIVELKDRALLPYRPAEAPSTPTEDLKPLREAASSPRLYVDLETEDPLGEPLLVGPLVVGRGELVEHRKPLGPAADAILGHRPSRGRIELNEKPLPPEPHRRRGAGLSGLLDPPSLAPDLTLEQHFRLAPHPARARALFLELLPEAAARLRTPAGVASGGERRLLALALATCDRPQALIVDGGWSGLSFAARRRASRLITDLRRSGTAVVLGGAPPK